MSDEPEAPQPPVLREVRYEHSAQWVPLLESLGCTLIVSTYQAGKIVVLSATDQKLNVEVHNFQQAMGVALSPSQIAVGTGNEVWLLAAAHQLAAELAPTDTYDACYVTRKAQFTGPIQIHELQFDPAGNLWAVNTLFSCLCTLHDDYSFVPRWRPPFISRLAAEDRCHLNGMAFEQGRPRFVTAMAEADVRQGWRATKATSGCILDVPSGSVIARGLSMPHSPRVYQDRLWVLNSGLGDLSTVEPATGKIQPVERVPGYTRGLAFCGRVAFVGMSRIRETSTFGGVPIAERREELRCGVAAVDLATGKAIAWLEFKSGISEIFDVQVLPNFRRVALSGPFPHVDNSPPIWVVPPPDQTPSLPKNFSAD